MSAPSRRQLLLGGTAVAAGAVAAEGTRRVLADDPRPGAARPPAVRRTDPTGATQAGVDRPATPPAHLHLHALTAPAGRAELGAVLAALAALGERILDLVDETHRADPAGDLTVQVGLGADLVELAGLSGPPGVPDLRLPAFAGSAALAPERRGGDLVLQVAADRPEHAAHAVDVLLAALAPSGFTPRWSQIGYRPHGDGTVTRNPFGYEDGIVQPRTTKGVPEHVWLGEGPLAGATIGVVRRFALDTAGFARLAAAEQDAVIGRERATSAPLSGGVPRAEVNLGAKSPAGAYLVPADAHARVAHPSFTDATVMLRRGYGFRTSVDGGAETSGLLFIAYQDDLSVFTRTQLRMDRGDRLMEFARPTAEAAFLVLPGFTRERPLGAALLG